MTTQISATQPDPHFHPGERLVCESVLHEGTKVTKSVRLWDICDPNTGDHKKYSVTIEREHVSEAPQSISLEASDKEESITRLHEFLAGAPQIDTAGEYKVVVDGGNPVGELLDSISTTTLDEDSISKVVTLFANSENVKQLAQLGSDLHAPTKSLAAALNHTRMSQVLDNFRCLVEQGCGECDGCVNGRECHEHTYQKFLEANFWIFGSEYSVLIPNRNFIKNRQVDFPLRRTVDGYLEVIEIKRPTDYLFAYKDGEIVGESSVVSKARHQVSEYLSNIDIKQNDILVEDEIAVEKVRGKIIVGRHDGDAERKKALRRLNAQLTRVEVITYDQLIATAQRMLDMLSEQRDVGDEHAGTEQITA